MSNTLNRLYAENMICFQNVYLRNKAVLAVLVAVVMASCTCDSEFTFGDNSVQKFQFRLQ